MRTTVLVTPCGSLAALAYLLPPGATAVVMNFYQAETGANVQLDDAAFWNIDHITLAYYPVGPEDYEGTSVGPPPHSPAVCRFGAIPRRRFALHVSALCACIMQCMHYAPLDCHARATDTSEHVRVLRHCSLICKRGRGAGCTHYWRLWYPLTAAFRCAAHAQLQHIWEHLPDDLMCWAMGTLHTCSLSERIWELIARMDCNAGPAGVSEAEGRSSV